MGARRLIAVVAAAPWVAWAVVRTFGLDLAWPLTALVPFTPYAAATAVIPALLAIALAQRKTAIVATVAFAALAIAVLPRALGEPAPMRSEAQTIRVLASNLLGDQGDVTEIARLVRRHRVDVVSLLELSPLAVARLDRAGGDELLPGRALEPRMGGAGSGILSRHPTTPVGGDSGDTPAQPAADVQVPDGRTIRVKAIHPFPPLTRDNSRSWRDELRELPSGDTGDGPELRILAGDFNATLDHRELRRLLDRGWTDAAATTGQGLKPTWPVGRFGPPITIDHVLVGPGLAVLDLELFEIPGSDHRAVLVTLQPTP